MKRKSNIFLMWMVLIALFTVMPQVKAGDDTDATKVPKELALFRLKKGDAEVKPVSTVPSKFIPDTYEYSAEIPFEEDTVYLAVRWVKDDVYTSVKGEGKGKLPITVKDGDKRIYGIKDTLRSSGSGYYDSIYVVKLPNPGVKIDGSVSFDLGLGDEEKTYKLTVTRVAGGTRSTLDGLYAVAYSKAHVDSLDSVFRKGFVEELKPAKDSVFFKELNTDGSPVVAGAYMEEDSVNWDQSIALLLRMSDANSKFEVRQEGENLKVYNEKKFYGNLSPYLIKPGLPVIIKVWAEDEYSAIQQGKAPVSEYKVTIHARPKPGHDEIGVNDTIKLNPNPQLDSLWLVDADGEPYTSKKKFDGTSDNADNLNYEISIPREKVVEAVVKYKWYAYRDNDSIAHIGIIQSELKKSDDGDYFEVQMKNLEGTTKKTYKLKLKYPDVSLKSFVVTSDPEGKKPLGLTPSFHADTLFYSAKMDYKTLLSNAYVWLTVNNTDSEIDTATFRKQHQHPNTTRTLLLSTAVKGEYKFRVTVDSAHKLPATYKFKVHDGKVENTYTLYIEKEWDLRLEKITLKERSAIIFEKEPKDEDGLEFRATVPADVKLENVEVEAKSVYGDDYVMYASGVISNSEGTSIRIRVFSPDYLNERIYMVRLRHQSSDASLNAIYVAQGELSPAFHSDVKDYQVKVPAGQEFVDIFAVASAESAVISGAGRQMLTNDTTDFTVSVTAEDGKAKKEYSIRVIRKTHTGIQLPGASSAQVYAVAGTLHVITPAAERVAIWSVDGKLLYSLDKPAGKVSVPGLSKGILILKGSSGWVKKAVI